MNDANTTIMGIESSYKQLDMVIYPKGDTGAKYIPTYDNDKESDTYGHLFVTNNVTNEKQDLGNIKGDPASVSVADESLINYNGTFSVTDEDPQENDAKFKFSYPGAIAEINGELKNLNNGDDPDATEVTEKNIVKIYAPTTSGDNNQILKAKENSAPEWIDQDYLKDQDAQYRLTAGQWIELNRGTDTIGTTDTIKISDNIVGTELKKETVNNITRLTTKRHIPYVGCGTELPTNIEDDYEEFDLFILIEPIIEDSEGE